MINEKKLIEEIDNCVLGLTNIQIMQIADIIESQPKVVEWIPCSERLPKENGNYFVTSNKMRKVYMCKFLKYADNGKVIDKWLLVGRTKITPIAWMELPEAYKGE